MNRKIDKQFIKASFANEDALKEYSDAVEYIGLWESEKIFFQQFFSKNEKILDIGCGAGRTTFGLYKLGYEHIVGLDLSEEMIEQAKQHNQLMQTDIPFMVGDATSLPFENSSFDHCLFSFNGFMQIPRKEIRLLALKEIYRILKPEGFFIFTTHDRDMGIEWLPFWEEELLRWQKGEQDKRLHEFGDRIIKEGNRMLFLHFPTREEVLETIAESGFQLVEDKWLPDIVDEPAHIRASVSDCRFWVIQK